MGFTCDKVKRYENEIKKMEKRSKKRMEFSQKILFILTLFWMGVVGYCLFLYTTIEQYPSEILTITTSVMVAIIGAYYTKTGFDNHMKIKSSSCNTSECEQSEDTI